MKRAKQLPRLEEIHAQVDLLNSVLLDLVNIGIEDYGNERGHALSILLACQCVSREIQRLNVELQNHLR